MSYQPKFYGDMSASNRIASYAFEMADILVRGKWIKADSFAASKLFSNLQLIKVAQEFAFYTTSQALGRTEKTLQDFHAKESQFNPRFYFNIAAFFDEFDDQGHSVRALYSAKLDCTGCQLVKSSVNGIYQSYWLRFEEATLSQHAAHRSTYGGPRHGHRNYGRGYWRLPIGPIGPIY